MTFTVGLPAKIDKPVPASMGAILLQNVGGGQF